MNSNCKIGIVENEEVFRNRLKEELLEYENISIWKNAEDCYRDNNLQNLDILLVDIGLPDMSGIDLIKLVKEKFSALKILVISGISSDDTIFQALQFGANGYIWKNELKELKSSIEDILNDGSVMSPSIGIRVLHFFRSRLCPSEEILSLREKQVLELIISGMKNNKIAFQLGISEGTIRKHINNIYKKLHVTNRVELMKKASEMGYF
jgi:DNA-binding NarL/FixJ family response regulator